MILAKIRGRHPIRALTTGGSGHRQTWSRSPFMSGPRRTTPCFPPCTADPFDRGLVCQTTLGGLTIVTLDEAIAQYPAPVLW